MAEHHIYGNFCLLISSIFIFFQFISTCFSSYFFFHFYFVLQSHQVIHSKTLFLAVLPIKSGDFQKQYIFLFLTLNKRVLITFAANGIDIFQLKGIERLLAPY